LKNLPKKESELISQLSKTPLAVVSHDAGGANVLHAFIQANNLTPNKLHVSGPACQIFDSTKILANTDFLDQAEVILASTGWQTDFEINFIKSAVSLGKRVIVFLDHWTNYENRLKFNSENVVVSEIVTFDEAARKLASTIFPESTIYCFENYYLREQSDLIAKLRGTRQEYLYDFLYIGEPIRGKGYSEEDALQYFISKVIHSGITSPKIAIRPHPSQSRDKYLHMLSNIGNVPIHVTQNTTLYDDLSISKAVVGCNSMALELAKMCQIPTYSAIPESFSSELPTNGFLSWET